VKRSALAIFGLMAVVAAGGGCGSDHTQSVSAPSPTASTAAPVTTVAPTATATAPQTTSAGQVPTVPDCGAGAFEPATLIIVCGTSSTLATGVHWTSWGAGSAAGAGNVQLAASGHTSIAPARLELSEVAEGTTGPQFTKLVVTWTGPSPDGHASDTFHLAAGSG